MEDQDRDHISSRSNFSGRSDQELDEMLDELRAGKIGINQPGQNSSEHDSEDTPDENNNASGTGNDSGEYAGKSKKGKSRKEGFNLKDEVISWIQVLVAAAIIAFCVNHFIIANSEVPTSSMETTIMAGDRVIGSR